MADTPMMDIPGSDLTSMIDTLVAKELDKTDLNIVTRCCKDLSKKFDDNVIRRLPEMQEIFKQLDEDVTKMEIESAEFNEELAKFSFDETPNDYSSLEKPETSILKPRHSQRQQQQQEQTYGATTESRKLEEMRQYVGNGRIQEGALHVGLAVLGKGKKEEWQTGEIIEIQKHQGKFKYKVLFNKSRQRSLLYAHQLACLETPQLFRLGQIGTGSRVAAVYNKEGLFSGVVAEGADRKTNKGRFLIFFDDGYALYCAVEEVFLVYGNIKDVWNDISYEATSKYIKDYLSTPERQMLSLKEGQTLKVEFNGEWHRGRVILVDCSLVEILYLSDNSRELVYRGSMRLQPLFQQQRTKPPNKIARAHTGARRNLIEIVDITGEPTDNSESSKASGTTFSIKIDDRWEAPWSRSLNDQKRMASQTTATRIPNSFTELSGGFDMASRIANKLETKSTDKSDSGNVTSQSIKSRQDKRFQNTIDDGIEVDSFPLNLRMKPQRFTPHQCSSRCVEAFSQWNYKKLAGVNPLIKPLLCGWTRDLCRIKPGSHRTSFHIYYRTPCGRACRNKRDVGRYIRECRVTVLDYDHFSFDHTVRAIIGHPSQNIMVNRPRDAKFFIPDYARGKEDMAISCVNEISMEEPPKMPYTKVRIQGRGVEINTNSQFMICCDCPDNCRDRSKCPCQQLTVQATSCSGGAKIKKDAGYQHKRLYSFLPTGIYECNPRCKCNVQCENRVVQKGQQCRLQMFKTQKKGWGIRCIDDIERGSFVCIYTGKIQTESNANTEGLLNGDEYLAELDHIEVAESQKDDYNSDASSGFNSGDDSSDSDSDKLNRQREDSTDTDEDTSNENKDRTLGAVTVIGGPTKKLGYSVGSFSPPLLPENLQKRRGKVMVMRKTSGAQDKSDHGFGQSRTSSSTQRDEDTTDTDSDIEPVVTRPPTARKSTTSRTSEKRADLQSDPDNVGTRRFFGSTGMFIIDAKQTGNLGRYLNHSCTPNLMVQNVFIDTHDLRFPWVAFFAGMNIRSGTELTWDYNYEIGSVPERVIHCYCGSTKCRKRLL